MGYKRRGSSSIVGKAQIRLDAVKQIDIDKSQTIDYGGPGRPITQVEFQDQITTSQTKNSEYNQILQQADAKLNDVKAEEQKLSGMYSDVLTQPGP